MNVGDVITKNTLDTYREVWVNRRSLLGIISPYEFSVRSNYLVFNISSQSTFFCDGQVYVTVTWATGATTEYSHTWGWNVSTTKHVYAPVGTWAVKVSVSSGGFNNTGTAGACYIDIYRCNNYQSRSLTGKLKIFPYDGPDPRTIGFWDNKPANSNEIIRAVYVNNGYVYEE